MGPKQFLPIRDGQNPKSK